MPITEYMTQIIRGLIQNKTAFVLLLGFLFCQAASAKTMLAMINEYRVENNLAEVVELPALEPLADVRQSKIKLSFTHTGFFSITNPLRNVGVWYENLAMEGNAIRGKVGVLNAWKKSPPHNANLLSGMQYVFIKKSGKYWVLEGWKPKP